MRALKSADLYFVAGSFCLCAALFFWLAMPKVQANRAARARLHRVVAETRELVGSTWRIERLTAALAEGDPFITKHMHRAYLEEQELPWLHDDAAAHDAAFSSSREASPGPIPSGLCPE
ncbi:MAG TPA: hypothetical protein PKX48_14165 [Planctomycetota bacterium]|nr:hypothetical protein [Planctomycetota bacterium]OQC19523.1 MAG: hypothetical protein BWX69_02632 [Planctomycetes bacterium ADurb.Bin069]HNR99893.1 hypothetical protein [Planctomycetota bacterium]HNU26409.1 hypothetical protein [Planctomycetota bacterium]HOE31241.1 hypothetical protein [Planctomycetota bacterium]